MTKRTNEQLAVCVLCLVGGLFGALIGVGSREPTLVLAGGALLIGAFAAWIPLSPRVCRVCGEKTGEPYATYVVGGVESFLCSRCIQEMESTKRGVDDGGDDTDRAATSKETANKPSAFQKIRAGLSPHSLLVLVFSVWTFDLLQGVPEEHMGHRLMHYVCWIVVFEVVHILYPVFKPFERTGSTWMLRVPLVLMLPVILAVGALFSWWAGFWLLS